MLYLGAILKLKTMFETKPKSCDMFYSIWSVTGFRNAQTTFRVFL